MSLIIILILVISTHLCSTNDHESLGKIVFANILYRHGDRTPIDTYPNDPYKNESLWPAPFGQLTNIGKHQHLLLGQWLRNRYINLLPEKYSLYDIYVRSSDVDRTLMSAEANLAGLYTPYGNEIWDIKKWMPIPVHTVPEQDDNILSAKRFCDKYTFELQRVLDSPVIQEVKAKNADLFQYLTEKSGRKISTIEHLSYIFSVLYIEELYNKTLPDWTKSVYPKKMKPLAEMSFSIQAYNKILQRLKSGPLLKEMINHMVLKSKSALTPDRKLWIYSAHDDTVANLMMTLNIFKPHCPSYTATLLIELRIAQNNEYVVTVSYKSLSEEPVLMIIPGCTAACPLNQFIRLTKDVIPGNWERECLMNFDEYHFNVNDASVIAILAVSLLMLVILLMIIITFFYWLYKKEFNQYYSRLSMENT